ncbi:MAG TPA: hypothetical protein VFT87_03540 [Candidatus Saccharimonadales bacterium]|nr:hypothetical protein [Candidatus Saccharimonadales bacterium]
MANKRKLHHWLTVLRRVKTWQLLLLLAVFFGLSLFLLRQNNLGMVERRNLVKQADEENSNVLVALTNLQQYVNAHMNTHLGAGVFLEHSYQRAYDAALKEAASVVNPNSAVYIQAENQCRQEFGSRSFQQYLQCVQQKVTSLAPGRDPLADVKVPPAELFRYNFISPSWSLDPAGIVVLFTAFIGVIILARVLGYIALKLLLRRHT